MHERILKDFLTLRLKKGATLLLALSGGVDSMALFHLLVEAKKKLDFHLHVAHVDHGWREESRKEGEALRLLAAYHTFPFHLHRLEKMGGGDLENRCRIERLAFFKRLHQKYHYQALLLAHQFEDQAETVFKRVAEGGGLRALRGLHQEREIEGLPIWRPLLSIKKEALASYLKKKRLHHFEDSTNDDPKYLRSRMRLNLFPTLETIFGKKIEGNFVRLGTMCQELTSYFEEKEKEIEKGLITGPFGSCLELDKRIHPLELKFFLKGRAPISHDALETLMKLIKKGRSSRLIHAGKTSFQLSRSHLFIYQNPFPDFFKQRDLWSKGSKGDWKEFWQGKVKVDEGVDLVSLSSLDSSLREKVKKWYSYHHVPSFFYDKAPLMMSGNAIIGECLTGKGFTPVSLERCALKG
ncbi:MAG: tRNA lysidine(34) synthetase TilS [Chlamydiia bacterium]|nr:tRNA lysidine(34) synthetase TilS [Chlamydiia bacterium]